MLDFSVMSIYNSSAAMKCNYLSPDTAQHPLFACRLSGISEMLQIAASCITDSSVTSSFLSNRTMDEEFLYCSTWNNAGCLIMAGKGIASLQVEYCFPSPSFGIAYLSSPGPGQKVICLLFELGDIGKKFSSSLSGIISQFACVFRQFSIKVDCKSRAISMYHVKYQGKLLLYYMNLLISWVMMRVCRLIRCGIKLSYSFTRRFLSYIQENIFYNGIFTEESRFSPIYCADCSTWNI